MAYTTETELNDAIWRLVHATPAIDLHTQLPSSVINATCFKLDELLTNSELLTELGSCASPFNPEDFFNLPLAERAEIIWQKLFCEQSPLSAATRGVLTTLGLLQLDPNERDLNLLRERAEKISAEKYLSTILQIANLNAVVVVDDLFGDEPSTNRHYQLLTALDLSLFLQWEIAQPLLNARGLKLPTALTKKVYPLLTNLLTEWCENHQPVYLQVSIGEIIGSGKANKILRKVILPFCDAVKIPLLLTQTSLENYNENLSSVAYADLCANTVADLCAEFPAVQFLFAANVEHQSLYALAQTFNNILLCNGLPNNHILSSSIANSCEWLSTNFVPFFSNAETIEQLPYKWAHARWEIGKTLQQQYAKLWRTGWRVSEPEIKRDVQNLLHGNFKRCTQA